MTDPEELPRLMHDLNLRFKNGTLTSLAVVAMLKSPEGGKAIYINWANLHAALIGGASNMIYQMNSAMTVTPPPPAKPNLRLA